MGKWLMVAIGVNLLLVDGAVGYLIYKSQQMTNDPMTTNDKIVYVDRCGAECQNELKAQISQLKTELTAATLSGSPPPLPLPSPTRVSQATPRPKTRRVAYVTVPGSGSTSKNDWTALSGTDFYFDLGDYPGLVEVYFEASVKLVNGNGIAYVRLYDTTHAIGVQGSEVQTSSQTASVATSGKVSFWQGKNLIKVQAKSLTADTAVFDSGRLRIVSEN